MQVKIQALTFSADEQMLASLGGQDDNSLVGQQRPQKAPDCSTADQSTPLSSRASSAAIQSILHIHDCKDCRQLMTLNSSNAL
jgi:hypothetical protein